jgi:clan AA aspartic protease (TIGR02281 family)
MKKIILLIVFIFSFTNYIFSQKVIEMNYENGIYTVPCKVNGVPMKFIFDTGASDVSISLIEAKFLIKQGLLTDDDIKGTVKYKIANGEIEEGTKIILKEINIDGYILENVEASIVHQLNAPLLLGQSAISKLGTFQLDGDKLIIQSNKHNELEFLGIDLTKDIEDFGFDRVNLEDVDFLFPVDFQYFNFTNNHFLKDFQFDNRKVVFDKKGNIAMIILQKLTFGNDYEKEKTSKNIYNSLIQKINDNYWVANTTKTRISTWKSKNLEILLDIDNDKSVNIVYRPKISRNLKSNLINEKSNNLKPIDKSNSTKIKELRLSIESLVNETLNGQSSVDSRKFARISNENLEFHSEIKIAYEGKKNEATKINEMVSYYMMLQFIPDDEIKNIFLDCNFEYLVFRVQITDRDYKKSNSIKKISKKNLINLKIPFTEQEIIEILE